MPPKCALEDITSGGLPRLCEGTDLAVFQVLGILIGANDS